MNLKHVGKDVVIREWVRFVRPEAISIGDYTWIDDFVLIAGGRGGAVTRIGNYVHIATFTSVLGGAGTTFEDFVVVAPGCRIFSDTDEYVTASLPGPRIPDEYHVRKLAPVVLERFALVGANCVIMPGVTIGEGASVGACSFVAGNLEAWTVNVGVPAQTVRFRDRDGVRARAEAFLSSQESG